MDALFQGVIQNEGGWDSVNRGSTGDTPQGIGTIRDKPIGSIIDMQNRREIFAAGAPQFTPGVWKVL